MFRNIDRGDILDIFLVSVLFYVALRVLRESRSQVALRGLIIVLGSSFLLYLLSQTMNLAATSWLFDRLWLAIALVFLICFQNEVKKALTNFGQLPFLRSFFTQPNTGIEEVAKAAVRLAEKKTGALICIERRNTLKTYADTGTRLNAEVSEELIRTVFSLFTPLHDGAVVLSGNRVLAAGCLLPLTQADNLPKELGTRHRAAIGLSEETDAIVVVVSEETGIISLVHDGQIERPETGETLRTKLRTLFEISEEEAVAEGT